MGKGCVSKVVKAVFLGVILLVGSNARAQQELHKADSLFAIGQYLAAQELYKSGLTGGQNEFRPNAILKLAYIAEINGDYTQSLYLLTMLSKITPSEAIYQKMEAIALRQRLSGYTFNDFEYLVLYLKKYGQWLFLFIVAITAYALSELVVKYKKNETITFVPKALVILFLTGLLVVLNIGELYSEGIVANSPTFLRERPSSASAVKGTIGKGNKVIVLGERDHWKLVYHRGKLLYIKKDDLLLI